MQSRRSHGFGRSLPRLVGKAEVFCLSHFSWISSMYWYAPHGDVPSNRELGAYPTKKLAMERLEREFEQAPGPPCRVLVKDGQKVIETSLSSQLFR